MTATITRAVRDGLVVTQRNVIKIKRVPDLIVFSTIHHGSRWIPRGAATFAFDGFRTSYCSTSLSRKHFY